MKSSIVAAMIMLTAVSFRIGLANAEAEGGPKPPELPDWTAWECAGLTEAMPSLWISECKGAPGSVTRRSIYFIADDPTSVIIVWDADPFFLENPSFRVAMRCSDNRWTAGAAGEKFRGMENGDEYFLQLRGANGSVCERFLPKPKNT